jgi:TnpA family transposase
MRILSLRDQEQFDKPPIFNGLQRKKFFNFTKAQFAEINQFRKPASKIGFLLTLGYFSATKKFFFFKDFHSKDIEYVSRLININPEDVKIENYPNSTRLRHEHLVMEYFGYKRFSESKECLLKDINQMVHDQLKPKLIFGRCLDLLLQAKVELPSSYKLSECIIESLNNHQKHLGTIVQENITPEIKSLLNDLFIQESSAKTSRYRLTLLKKISQSTKPTKVKERVEDLKYLTDLYTQLSPVISAMNLRHEGIRYFAGSVLKSQIFQLHQRSDEDRYVHAIAFVAHQYYRLQDNLAEVLLSVVRTFQNTVQREHKDRCYEQRKTNKQHLSSFLERLDKDFFSLVKEIQNLSHDEHMSDANKVKEIQDLLEGKDTCEGLKEIKSELESEMNPIEYNRILESRSVRLQNRVSPIIKSLDFQAESGASELITAIQYFKLKDGVIKHDSPIEFLNEEQKKTVMVEEQINPSLYKAFMFMHIANAIKSGTLNLKHSYKYRPLDDYIISKDRWRKEKEQLIRQAGLEDFTDCKKVLKKLDDDLYQQYLKTNKSIKAGKNGHFKKFPAGGFRIATPALEEKENDPLQAFFPEKHFVPLTEVLATVNYRCGFIDQIQHHQQKHTHKKGIGQPALFASLMGLGCGIGTRKMAHISSSVKSNEIEQAVNWYLSLENIQAANDAILKVLDKMELPNIYRRNKDKLHTSSDGQKFTVKGDSLNANYSFKYGGKEQVASAYSFIDERALLWHSLVFSAAERESAYVIDGLMHNDVIKSDIHSTDTHGYSEVIFGTTHLLGFSYAPRIKNLKKQTTYIFKSRKTAVKSDWSITPTKYISEDIIIENWDDLLRLVCTIKMKESTASDIFRRLNSYSKQHDLYKAMKAFGQIIKSDFILRYLDDLELRQAIEKQLNKVELANKFTRAVAVGSPREFTQGAKEDQEISVACNQLIKNAIICWNYMFLDKKLKSAENEAQREIIMNAIKNHSPISWAHINLLGEYDFSENKLRDSAGVLPSQNMDGFRERKWEIEN